MANKKLKFLKEGLKLASKWREYVERYRDGRIIITEKEAIRAHQYRKKLNDFIERLYKAGIFGENDVRVLYLFATDEDCSDFSLFRALQEGKDHPTLRAIRERKKQEGDNLPACVRKFITDELEDQLNSL